jgi:hypothetical protein
MEVAMSELSGRTSNGGANRDAVRSTGSKQAQESSFSQQATKIMDSAREPIADKLHGAAASVRRAERFGRGKVANAAQSAAEKFESSATYLESHDSRQMLRDLWALMKRHPVGSVLAAAVVGFLIARSWRSD